MLVVVNITYLFALHMEIILINFKRFIGPYVHRSIIPRLRISPWYLATSSHRSHPTRIIALKNKMLIKTMCSVVLDFITYLIDATIEGESAYIYLYNYVYIGYNRR